jgi:hypothetical protein
MPPVDRRVERFNGMAAVSRRWVWRLASNPPGPETGRKLAAACEAEMRESGTFEAFWLRQASRRQIQFPRVGKRLGRYAKPLTTR